MCICFFKFYPVFLKRKNQYKFLMSSLTTLKIVQKATSRFLFRPFFSYWSTFAIYIHGQLWENFQEHRRLSEQLLESQEAIGKPKQAPRRGCWKDFTISKLFHIKKQAETLFLGFYQKKTQKEKKICAHS